MEKYLLIIRNINTSLLPQRGFGNGLFLFEHMLLRNPDDGAVLLNRTATALVLKSDRNYCCNFIHRVSRKALVVTEYAVKTPPKRKGFGLL